MNDLPTDDHAKLLATAALLRPDLQAVAELIPTGTRILDLGCSDGELLEHLVYAKQAKGRGIELSEAGVMACVSKGLSVRQGNLNEGLADYPNASFDFVILSQTLPFLSNPARILEEMLRVGHNAIVSFPNWGYWRCRLAFLLSGRLPQVVDLPHNWYDSPRMQVFTITDFAHFCRQIDIQIQRELYLSYGQRITPLRFKNLLATTAVFALKRTISGNVTANR